MIEVELGVDHSSSIIRGYASRRVFRDREHIVIGDLSIREHTKELGKRGTSIGRNEKDISGGRGGG